VRDARGANETFTYDAADRLTAEIHAVAGVTGTVA
jgi:YD repeat-containing protein